jgi:hypothetical protein
VLSAVIWSSTSFWLFSACATMTAVRSARSSSCRPVDALDELDVVLDDDVDRQVVLDRDGSWVSRSWCF